MPTNASYSRRRARFNRVGIALMLVIGVLSSECAMGEPAQEPAEGQDNQEALAKVQRAFDPPVIRMANEQRVIRAQALETICSTPEQASEVSAWLARRGFTVLHTEQSGLTIHLFAEGIEKMTPADRVWEGLPRQATSLQDLVDHSITRARSAGQPIGHLIVTGHAGLPGCSALGGTLDDCTFNGRLTGYQRRQLRRLQPYFTPESEIELRQCVTGSGKEGQRLLTAIHQTTSAAVSSYLSDFHFGDSAAHPRIRIDREGIGFVQPDD